jgi:hypothetical protein
VERGRLKPGDEMTVAHLRYRLEAAPAAETTAPAFRDRPEPYTREMGTRSPDGLRNEPENSGSVA